MRPGAQFHTRNPPAAATIAADSAARPGSCPAPTTANSRRPTPIAAASLPASPSIPSMKLNRLTNQSHTTAVAMPSKAGDSQPWNTRPAGSPARSERALGRSSTARRRNSGISAPVPSQAMSPAPTMIAATSAKGIIAGRARARSGSRGGARLAPERPADDGAVRPGCPAQHDLLGFFCLARAEVDALAEAHRGARRAYAPYRAARQPQHRRAIVGGERRLDRGMQMKAHCELDARAAGQLVLAAQIVAVGGQIELARIGQTKARLVQIVPRHEPLMPGFLGAVPMHGRRGLAD